MRPRQNAVGKWFHAGVQHVIPFWSCNRWSRCHETFYISLSQPLWRSPSKFPLQGWTLLAYVKLHQILVGIWYWFFGEHKSAATLGEIRESDYASRLLCRHFDSPCCPKSWNAERFDMSLPTFGIGPCWSCFREEYAGVGSAGNLQSLERQKSAIHNCRPAVYNTTVTTTPRYSQQPAIKFSSYG